MGYIKFIRKNDSKYKQNCLKTVFQYQKMTFRQLLF